MQLVYILARVSWSDHDRWLEGRERPSHQFNQSSGSNFSGLRQEATYRVQGFIESAICQSFIKLHHGFFFQDSKPKSKTPKSKSETPKWESENRLTKRKSGHSIAWLFQLISSNREIIIPPVCSQSSKEAFVKANHPLCPPPQPLRVQLKGQQQ